MTPPTHPSRRLGDCCAELDTVKDRISVAEKKADALILEGCAHRVEAERRVSNLEEGMSEVFKLIREEAANAAQFREKVLLEIEAIRKDFMAALHTRERALGVKALQLVALALFAVLGYVWAVRIEPVLDRAKATSTINLRTTIPHADPPTRGAFQGP